MTRRATAARVLTTACGPESAQRMAVAMLHASRYECWRDAADMGAVLVAAGRSAPAAR